MVGGRVTDVGVIAEDRASCETVLRHEQSKQSIGQRANCARRCSGDHSVEHGDFSEDDDGGGVDARCARVSRWLRRAGGGQAHDLFNAFDGFDVNIKGLGLGAPSGDNAGILSAGECR